MKPFVCLGSLSLVLFLGISLHGSPSLAVSPATLPVTNPAGFVIHRGVAWANWEYKGDFGILEWHSATRTAGAPDLELIQALLGPR